GALASAKPVAFTGYDALHGRAQIRALIRGGESGRGVGEGDRVELGVDETPFYAESGGQVGDVGEIAGPEGKLEVEDVQKPVEGLIVHKGRIALGRLAVGDSVDLKVDAEARAATVRNHSGTH